MKKDVHFEGILACLVLLVFPMMRDTLESRGSAVDAKSDYSVYCIWMQYC